MNISRGLRALTSATCLAALLASPALAAPKANGTPAPAAKAQTVPALPPAMLQPPIGQLQPANGANVPALPNLLTPTQTAAPAPLPGSDLAYSAYQSGFYITAALEAIKRVNAGTDPAALTLLGELYARGFGVPYDPQKAGDYYRRAAGLGDTNAMFALGMMALTGQGIVQNDAAAARWFQDAASKGHGSAAYNLGLLYMQGRGVNAEMRSAAQWFRTAADAGVPDAEYALAVLLREGNGVVPDRITALRLMREAALQDHVTAQVELAIATFNGDGVMKDEAAAAALFRKAALAGNAIAQNRYARLLSAGRGAPQDKTTAAAWHLLAKMRGLNDTYLDEMVASLPAEDRQKAAAIARKWAATTADAKMTAALP
ncbi:MAG: hypothetical protein B7Y84_09510 [Azorhizobium sp. 32-67-21]|nr:MAG: hypothetical protein B7Z30_12885 [Rhizobiales bacterium 12-68-15]OYX88142.1 MAG: hypothetical protein B7Y84_09510 [Azorhizobium sp. 32-67-21]